MAAEAAQQHQSAAETLRIEGLTRRIGGRTILDRVDLDVRPGEILGLLGHSGCGKSTLLRLVAGVDRPSAGMIRLDGETVADEHCFVEPERRGVGLMFQDYALFPHLTVERNVGFGLRHLARRERAERVASTLERIGIGHFAERYPHTLSGGEQQRVALARALAPDPRVLLMDEPFSNLDSRLRDRVRAETIALVRRLAITAILVTHDPQEALAVCDRIALMHEGRILQTGSGRELYDRPASPFVARFFGDFNEFAGICRAGRLSTPLGPLPADFADGAPVLALVRPAKLRLDKQPDGVPCRVLEATFGGEVHRLVVEIAGHSGTFTVRMSAPPDVIAGQSCFIVPDLRGAFVFEASEPPA